MSDAIALDANHLSKTYGCVYIVLALVALKPYVLIYESNHQV